ncbi:MAG: hypothetical protein IJP92_14165, partial [Lachnospiraceae bacterium]|nr:hypothetical protein [Lachnospiraceae bacterium]
MKNTSVKTILACLPAVIAVLLLVVFVTLFMRGREVHEVIRMDSGWRVTFADSVLEDVTLSELPELLGRRLQKGEELRLEQSIPGEIHESPTLEMLINYFAAEVFLDGERIAAPAFERYSAGYYVGGSRYFINLPAEHAGKTLSLVLYAGENGLKPVLYPPRLGEFHDLIHVMIGHYGYALLIGIFMCLFGGFFLLFSLFVSVLLPEIRGQRVSSLLSILFGVWILTHYRILTVVTGGAWNMTVEYIAFYACLPLLYHLVSRIRETNRIFRAMQMITTGGVLLSVLLHSTGILYMHRLRYAYYVLCTAFLALLLTMFVTDLKQKRMRALDIIQMAAPTLFCLSIFIAMIINLPSGEDIEVQTVSIVILTTGPLLFAMTRFLIYNWMMMEAAPQKFAFASLQQMAYTDSLTGLKNR